MAGHHRAFNAAAAVSLVVCVATAAMWVRSEFRADCAWSPATVGGGRGTMVVYSGNGALLIERAGPLPRGAGWAFATDALGSASSFAPAIGGASTTPPVTYHAFAGVYVSRIVGWITTPSDRVIDASRPARPVVWITVRYSVPTLLAALLPAVAGIRAARRIWRRRHGPTHPSCGRCGYDLTGNVSGVCPECGSAVAT